MLGAGRSMTPQGGRRVGDASPPPTDHTSSAPGTLQCYSAGLCMGWGLGFIIIPFSQKQKERHSAKRQRGSPSFHPQQGVAAACG